MPKFDSALKLLMLIAVISGLGVVFYQTGNPLDRFEEYKQIDKDRSTHLNNEAIFSFTNGKYELGLSQLDEALKLNPNNSIALYNAGIFFIIFRMHIAEVRYGDRSEFSVEKVLDECIEYNDRILILNQDDEDTMVHYAENLTFIYMIRQSDEIFDYKTLRKAKNMWMRLYSNHPKRIYWNYIDTCLTILREAGHNDIEYDGTVFKPDA